MNNVILTVIIFDIKSILVTVDCHRQVVTDQLVAVDSYCVIVKLLLSICYWEISLKIAISVMLYGCGNLLQPAANCHNVNSPSSPSLTMLSSTQANEFTISHNNWNITSAGVYWWYEMSESDKQAWMADWVMHP